MPSTSISEEWCGYSSSDVVGPRETTQPVILLSLSLPMAQLSPCADTLIHGGGGGGSRNVHGCTEVH